MSSNIQPVPVRPAARMQHLPEQFFASLVSKVGRITAEGYDVINLGQGNPDLPTPPHIVKSMQLATANPKYHRYSPFDGYPFLKEAVAYRYEQDYGVKLDPEKEIAILAGAKTGLVEISHCLLNPGDVCLVPDPGYPDYWSGIAMAEARMVGMPLTRANSFLPDYTAIAADDVKQARLLFVNYPGNPTGAVAPASFYEETIRFAADHKIIVISDFAYGAIGFDGHRPISFMQLPDARKVGIEFYTLSKTYNMAGWRVGFAVGNAEVIRLINLIQDHYYCSLFGAIQEAAAEALTGPQDCVRSLVDTYEHRRNIVFDGLKRIGWHAAKPGGSFFCWLPVPNGMSSMPFADLLLNRAHIVVAPGSGFGAYGEGYVRLALLSDETRLQEAIHRIAHADIL